MNEFSNGQVSIVLSKDWVADSSKVGGEIVFQGHNGNKYIILSSHKPNMTKFANMKEAMSDLNKMFMEGAQDTVEGKAGI